MRRLIALLAVTLLLAPSAGAANGSLFTVSPTSNTINASDPDSIASTSTTTTANWTISNGNKNTNWSLAVQASASTMQNCTQVQVSAIQVACSSVSLGSCASPFQLSTAPQTIATGGASNGNALYQVQFQLSFADSWSYVAASSPSCTVTLQYSLQVQ